MSDVDVPKIGPVNKKVLIAVGVAAAGFVGWRYWQSRNATAAPADATTDPGFADSGTIPSVDGADISSGSGGSPEDDSNPPSTDTFGFTGTTNSQWTQYVLTQLTQSDVWSYTDIATALGNYLNDRALSSVQQQIVQAAIAVAGYPPQGSHVIIPGGDTTHLVAPGGLRAGTVTSSSVALSWDAVAGASGYEIYRSGTAVESVSGTSGTVSGLSASTSYSFTVAALDVSGTAGPQSSSVTAKTSAPQSTTPPTSFGGGGVTTPKPPGSVHQAQYPTRRTYYVVVRNDNFSTIAAKEHTGLSGEQLYQYQFTPQAGRSASAQATLRKRGPNLVVAGETVAIPYPK